MLLELAIRRHGHLALTAEDMLAICRDNEKALMANFNAISNFIGTEDADVASHIGVSTLFLNQLWKERGQYDPRCMEITGLILSRLIHFRTDDWHIVLVRFWQNSSSSVRKYWEKWIKGHFLPFDKILEADRQLRDISG